MRYYQEISAEPKWIDRAVHRKERADKAVLYEVTSVLYQLGFSSDKILAQLQISPDKAIARNAFQKARDPERYRYPDLDDLVGQLTRLFSRARLIPLEEV